MSLVIFLGVLIAAMAVGVPIAFSLILCAVAMGLALDMFDPQIISQRMIVGANSFTLLAIPFFLLAGELMNAGGMSRRIVAFAISLAGHVRGGLGVVAIFAAIILASLAPETAEEPAPQIVSRSTGGRGYGVSLGLYRSRHEAEQLLLRTALQDSAALGNAVSRVADTRRGFQANFEGMSRQMAELTCDRLAARQQDCTVIGQ